MFMVCNGAFYALMNTKEDKYVSCELICELWNRLLILQENTKFSEYNSL